MTLADEILASHFTLEAVPGLIDSVGVDDVSGWIADNPHPVLTLMRWTTDDYERASAALLAVLSRLQSEHRGFDWMTGPTCEAAGLLPLLEEQGFIRPPLSVAAMVKHLTPNDDYELSDGVEVWKVEDEEDPRTWQVMASGFDVAAEIGEVFHRAYLAKSPAQQTELYAASIDGTRNPLGVGYLSYIGETDAVLLRVSSVSEQHRGKGIYTSLVKQRLADARARGRSSAYVHAYSADSQKSLRNLGFETVGELKLHRWRP